MFLEFCARTLEGKIPSGRNAARLTPLLASLKPHYIWPLEVGNGLDGVSYIPRWYQGCRGRTSVGPPARQSPKGAKLGGGGKGGLTPHQSPPNPELVPPINFGIGGKNLGAKRPKLSAQGSVLETFCKFFENLLIKCIFKSFFRKKFRLRRDFYWICIVTVIL